MNLYLIWQKVNVEYDTYDSAVVAAESEDDARSIHPNGLPWDGKAKKYDDWCDAEHVEAKLLGIADEYPRGVVCASYNAG